MSVAGAERRTNPEMNVLAVGPALLRRVLDDLGAVGRTARQLDGLRAGLLTRLDTLNELRAELRPIQELSPVHAELEAVRVAIQPLGDKLDRLRDDIQPIEDLSLVRAGIEPLDDDMRRVRESIDAIEPSITGISSAV